MQEFLQGILEQEIMEFLGRKKGQRKSAVDNIKGYRNGYGKTRKFTTTMGTITVRRPRMRGTEEHFQSKAMPYALTKSTCEKLRDAFAAKYQEHYPKAVQTLNRDWERMVTFYSFSKEHWVHIRTRKRREVAQVVWTGERDF